MRRDGVRDLGDYLLTFKILATQGIDIPIDLPAEEVEAELERLEARLEEKRKSYLVLIPTKLQKLETAELERRIAILKGLQVEIPVSFTSGATGSRAGVAPPEISKEQLADLDRLLEQAKDTREKVQEQIDLLNKGLAAGQFPGIEGLKQYAKAYAYLQEQLDKPPKKTGLSEAQQAQKAIGDLITQMEQQIAVTGETEEATIRYRIAYRRPGRRLQKGRPGL